MRHSPSHAGRATLLACSFVGTLACVPPAAVDARRAEKPPEAAARAAIQARIAERVEATIRKDADALLRDAEPVWSAADGRPIARSEMADILRREWATVERTIELTVRVDSLRLVHADSADVFTSQHWQRILRGEHGARHQVRTSAWMEQRWARRAGEWRGVGAPRVLREGPVLVDGVQSLAVRGQ